MYTLSQVVPQGKGCGMLPLWFVVKWLSTLLYVHAAALFGICTFKGKFAMLNFAPVICSKWRYFKEGIGFYGAGEVSYFGLGLVPSSEEKTNSAPLTIVKTAKVREFPKILFFPFTIYTPHTNSSLSNAKRQIITNQ